MTIEVTNRQVTVADVKVVEGSLPANQRKDGAWLIEALDRAGTILASNSVDAPNSIRTSMMGDDGGSYSTVITTPNARFNVDMPLTPTAVRVRLLADPKTMPTYDIRSQRTPVDGRVPLGDGLYPSLGK